MPPQSGFRAFSTFITSMSGVESLRWTARFVWVNHCERGVVRLTRSRLSSTPENLTAFKLADLVGEAAK